MFLKFYNANKGINKIVVIIKKECHIDYYLGKII